MNVTAKVQDNTVDARSRDAAKRQSNGQSADDAQQFDGVLTEVKSDAKSEAGKAKPPSALPDASSSTSVTAAALTAAAPAEGQTVVATNVVSMDALLELLGKGTSAPGQTPVPTDPAAKPSKDAKAKGTADTAQANEMAADVLQKLAAKDAASATDTPPPQSAPAAAPTDLVSLLMLGAAAAPAAATASTTAPPQEGDTKKKSGATAIPGARAMPLDGTDHADPKEVIVSDISVETHLAPAAPNNVSSLAPTQRKASKQGAPDMEAISGKEATPASLDVSSQITGALSAPVRSIANAVVDLASRTEKPAASTAAPLVEQSKTVLGVARTMTLQMNPANLGTVDIRMHMTGQTLDVQLTVSDPRTLGMVNRERDALATALGDQSYALNSLVIQDGGAAASSGGNNAASQGDTGGNARSERQSGGYGSDGQAGGNRSPHQGADRKFQDEQGVANDAASRAGTSVRSGSLFV